MATRLVALLRGINVGRSKRVPMIQLRELLVGLGYTDVTTYLQSGNAVFTCTPKAARMASQDIEEAVAREAGVTCRVIVRSPAELAAAIAADPLLGVATDPARHLVGFLAADPQLDAVARLDALDVSPDQIRVVGRHVYLWCPNGVLASPLNKVGWERSLGVAATTRNWSTVTKLAALAGVGQETS